MSEPEDADLALAIERAPFIYPGIPGVLWELGIPGLRGYETPIKHPNANLIGCARLDEDATLATIAGVRERFAASGKAFGWLTSPLSRPADLPRLLSSAGLLKAEELAGMAITDLNPQIETNPGVTIRPATPAEMRAATSIVAASNGFPAEMATWYAEMWIGCGHRLRWAMYHGFVTGHEGPVSYGAVVFIPGTSVVVLAGSATVLEARGRGVYTAMVARRLVDARAAGASAAVILAVRGTSAPLCARLGFSESLPLEYYVGPAPDARPDQLC